MKACQFYRLVHRWGAVIIAVPIGIVIVTGIILQLKNARDIDATALRNLIENAYADMKNRLKADA